MSKVYNRTEIDGDLAVGRKVVAGGELEVKGKGRSVIEGSLKVDGLIEAKYIKENEKGLFTSVDELNKIYPNPRPGWFALVLDTAIKGNGFLYVARGGKWELTDETSSPYDFIQDSINVFASKGELAEETQRAQGAENILTQRIVNETVRATEAENEIKKNAVKFNRIGITGYADKLELMAATIDGDEVHYIDIPAATETKAGVVSAEDKKKLDSFSSIIQELSGDALYITDQKGNVIAKMSKDGIKSVEVEDNSGHKLSQVPSGLVDFYDNAFVISDRDGNAIASFNRNGIKTTEIEANNVVANQWNGKVLATYGDSVTALNGGDWEYPYPYSSKQAKWGGKVADYFKFSKLYNRGIGSTTFNYYNDAGGQVAWVKTDTGEYVNRNDNYNYDNYIGSVNIPSDCTPIRGCGSSWLRITTMFHESFKDSVDVVLVMFHNDFHQDMETECAWVEGSSKDAEWYASEYYQQYGGDYNIECVKGGIASVVMKLQAWMPQALIVLMTPISGVYINGNDEVKDLENSESTKMKQLADVVKEISYRMSIPCIDVYGTDCINTLNHKKDGLITDGIHPYSDAGCKKIARAIISGLNPIMPNIQ